jgi:hypothetical protein
MHAGSNNRESNQHELKKAMERMIFKPLGMKHTYVFEYETDKDTAVTLQRNKVEIGKTILMQFMEIKIFNSTRFIKI